MNFETTGEGTDYFIEKTYNDSIWDNNQGFREIDSIGEFITMNFNFLKLNPYTLNITRQNLTEVPIGLRNMYGQSIHPLEGSNFTEIRQLNLSPFYNQQLEFRRRINDSTQQEYIHIIEATGIYGPNEIDILLTEDSFQ
ncbi:MAG: hypothetical protein AAF688_06560 [Bacteroidota bacterium]